VSGPRLDRIYLNAYIPRLQTSAQVVAFLSAHLGYPFPSPALICDLSGVANLDPVFATVFSTVANHPASRWPTTSFLLRSGQPQVAQTLNQVHAAHLVPLYASLEEVLEAAMARPAHLRHELRLAPSWTAAAAARAFVREVFWTWELARPDETLLDRAVLVANELVTNAVIHAHGDLWLQLELRADRLFIAVRDGGPRLLRPVPPELEAEGGRGLWLVEQLTQAWGAPHPDGGNFVVRPGSTTTARGHGRG
jgi:anti-sigma regulatory factor (Ser/Thr protein kinase)